MGSTKSSESKSASGSGQQWATPFAQAAAGQVANVYNQNQPNLQATTDLQRQQVVNPLISEFNSTLPTSTAASGYYGDVLNGKYLNGNPYLGQVTDQLNRNVADQVNSQFENAGRYGSDSYAQTLARETGAADANLSYNNYQNGLNQMGQAAQGATTQNIGTEQALASAVGQNAALPYVGSQAYAGSLGQLMNGGTSSGVTYQPNPIFGALGAGLGAAGSIFQGQGPFLSDRRLKTNIELLHRDPDGLGWYSWNWKADPEGPKVRGVIADEVEKLRPQAFIPNFRGEYSGVNYAAL
jgi:hypothetical protein